MNDETELEFELTTLKRLTRPVMRARGGSYELGRTGGKWGVMGRNDTENRRSTSGRPRWVRGRAEVASAGGCEGSVWGWVESGAGQV